MNGQELYIIYQNKMAEINNCEVDDWIDLESGDRKAWNAMADELERKS